MKIKRKNEMGQMWSSPHKKRRLGLPAPGFAKIATVNGVRTYRCIWPYKTQVSKAADGNKGTRYRKKHINAQTPPGTPNGEHSTKVDPCECGRCRQVRSGNISRVT